MVIDSHAHVTAPDGLYVYKAALTAHRGAHGRGAVNATDDDIHKALNSPVFGGSSHLEQLKEAGTDMQIISPRPYQMMTSENPRIVQWYTEETNNIIAHSVKLYPKVFRGVCGLPLTPGVSPKAVLPYLERCIKEQGFVGLLLNPDPGECSGVETPAFGDRFWYPLYEKMVELDIPGHIHSTGCKSERLSYSLHFINEESISVVSLLNSTVFTDFPKLKIVVSHAFWPWIDQGIGLLFRRPNVSLLPDQYGPTMPGHLQWVEAANTALSDRFLFGSAYPSSLDPKGMVEAYSRLPYREEVKRKIFYENAARLLGIVASGSK